MFHKGTMFVARVGGHRNFTWRYHTLSKRLSVPQCRTRIYCTNKINNNNNNDNNNNISTNNVNKPIESTSQHKTHIVLLEEISLADNTYKQQFFVDNTHKSSHLPGIVTLHTSSKLIINIL